MMREETTRCCRTTLFDDRGEITGYCKPLSAASLRISLMKRQAYCVKFFSWWLGTGSLAIYCNRTTRKINALMLGLESLGLRDKFLELLDSKKRLAAHPFLVVLIFCEVLAENQEQNLRTATTRILTLETTIGVNDYAELARGNTGGSLKSLDFDYLNRSLNGELSRLANYEKWVKSIIALLDTIVKGTDLDKIPWADEPATSPFSRQLTTNMREYAEYLQGWNVDLLARTVCQQKIVNGQIQTVLVLP